MIPKWQIVALMLLALLALAVGIYDSPNSYAYAFLSGACNHAPMPRACARGGRYGSSLRY